MNLVPSFSRLNLRFLTLALFRALKTACKGDALSKATAMHQAALKAVHRAPTLGDAKAPTNARRLSSETTRKSDAQRHRHNAWLPGPSPLFLH